MGAHPTKGEATDGENVVKFRTVHCATSNPPTLGYLWAAYRPPSREESRVEAHGPTKGPTLGGENFATLAISKSTLKPKMSIGPYSLVRVLQVGWWTLGVPQ